LAIQFFTRTPPLMPTEQGGRRGHAYMQALGDACLMQANECSMHVESASTDEREAETSTALNPPPRGKGIAEISVNNTFSISRNWDHAWECVTRGVDLCTAMSLLVHVIRQCERTSLFSQGCSCRRTCWNPGFFGGRRHLPCKREQAGSQIPDCW
jgi:hypothetical protein